jgi:hypothetical protein
MFSDDTPDDLEKTTKMDDEPASEPSKKKADDWITAPMPAAKPKAQPKPQAPPASPSEGAAAKAPTAQPAPTSSRDMPKEPGAASGGGFGSFLSNFGIEDPKTQQIVLIVGIAVILLCCACICLTFGSPFVLAFLDEMAGGSY